MPSDDDARHAAAAALGPRLRRQRALVEKLRSRLAFEVLVLARYERRLARGGSEAGEPADGWSMAEVLRRAGGRALGLAAADAQLGSAEAGAPGRNGNSGEAGDGPLPSAISMAGKGEQA